MKKIRPWTYCVKNIEILARVKEKRNVLHSIKKRGRLTYLVTSCIETAF